MKMFLFTGRGLALKIVLENMKYFTSDWHIGHKNILNYCQRPFTDLDAMKEHLIQSFNAKVKPEDTTYFLGDFSLNPKYSGEVIPRLNGTKILVVGNHDSCFPLQGREQRSANQRARYYRDGWSEIHLHLPMHLKDGRHVILSHLPYASEDGQAYDKRYMSYRPKDQGAVLLHGHLHGRYIKSGRMIDVGLDAHELKVLSEDDIIRIINDPRDFIPSTLTEYYKLLPTRENMVG